MTVPARFTVVPATSAATEAAELTTDTQGRCTLTTVIPGIYPGWREHIHVKVNAPGGPVNTTQLFFPGSHGNSQRHLRSGPPVGL